jgi:hypothetical protein
MIGILFTLIFVSLLAVRLGILQKGENDHGGDLISNVQAQMDREIWMNILQQGQKIGYVHRQFLKTDEGYETLESVFMRINALGMVQDVRVRTKGYLKHDLTLSSFDFELQSSLFRFKVQGAVRGKILNIFMGAPGSQKKIEIPLEKDIFLPVGILEAFVNQNPKPGESRTFHVFDPTTMAQRPVKVKILTEEEISVMGYQEKARKVSVDFMGAPQFAWIGRDGTVLKEEGSLGIKLEQVAREEALQKVAHMPGSDIVEIVSLSANRVLYRVDQLNELKVKVNGIEEGGLFLEGDRQSLEGNILTIRKESISHLPSRSKAEKMFSEKKTHLESSPLIQSDHPEIKAKVKEIISPMDSDVIKAKKLVSWVHKNIQKRPVLSIPNALETLQNRVGDCNEHAVLLAAMARASGIPTQVEAGLVYQRGRFYYHAWNVLYLGTWITVDSVMGQFPADVTHIRFVRGTERQIDLIGIIGKVGLEILSMS